MTIWKHYCPHCSARMEFAGAHCGREDCKSAAYVTALKASGATSVESFEDGRDPIAGPRIAEMERLSKKDSEAVRGYLFKLAECKIDETGKKIVLSGPAVGRLYPSVDQSILKAYPLAVGHSGPYEFRDWYFIGKDSPPTLQRDCPRDSEDKFVRVFYTYHLNGWVAETYGGRTTSERFLTANEAMLWANKYLFPSAAYQSKPLPAIETKYGVWFVSDPTYVGRTHCWCILNEGRGPTSGTLAQAQAAMAQYRNRFPMAEYQIRTYVNEHVAGNLYIEPTPDNMTVEEAATVLSGKLLSEPAFHLAKAYDFKWKVDPTDPSKPEKLKAEKLSNWTRVNFRDLPNNGGRVCDYVREVPERNLTFKIQYYEDARGSTGLVWCPCAKYADQDWTWLLKDFKTVKEAKAFCNEKAKER